MTLPEQISNNMEKENRIPPEDSGWDSVAEVPFNEGPIINDNNSDQVVANMVHDQNINTLDQKHAEGSQDEAVRNEITEPLTDEEFKDFVDTLLNEQK